MKRAVRNLGRSTWARRAVGITAAEFPRLVWKTNRFIYPPDIYRRIEPDMPKVARKAELGIIMLSRESGRRILPVAVAASWFKRFDNWDRSVVHLPFERGVITMQTSRAQLENHPNAVTRRAYQLVGRPSEGCDG